MDDRVKTTGKQPHDDLDLDLPEEPLPAQTPAPPPSLKSDTIEFECPSCGSSVPESATKCPHCGATFSESDQFDCPVCGSAVAFEAVQCPKCGIRFVEETGPTSSGLGLDLSLDLGPKPNPIQPSPTTSPPQPAAEPPPQPTRPMFERPTPLEPVPSRPAPVAEPIPQTDPAAQQLEMSGLVGEVKELIVIGKRVGLALGNVSEAITQAVGLARKKEMAEALSLMKDAREALKRSFLEQLNGRLATLASSLNRPGGREGPAAAAVREAQSKVQQGDISGAVAGLEKVQTLMASGDPRALQARNSLERSKGALAEAAAMGFQVTGADELVLQASRAIARGEWDMASGLANQAWDLATSTIKNSLAEEMKRCRNMVFELKMRGEGVDRAIELLKQASLRLKEGDAKAAHKILQILKSDMPRSR